MSQSRLNALFRVFSGGAAHAGSRHWCAQRLTAIALIPLTIWFLVSLLLFADYGYATVLSWVAAPRTAALLCLLVVALCWHSLLGVQVVIEDYVHHRGINATLLLLSTFLHVLAGAAALLSVLKIAGVW